MSKKRGIWLVLVVAIAAVMSALVAVQTEAGPPNCRFVLCAYPDCIEGEHTEIPAGQCCPVCVPD